MKTKSGHPQEPQLHRCDCGVTFALKIKCPSCRRVIPADILILPPELNGTFPVVLYFRSNPDREEFVAAVVEAKPNMIARFALGAPRPQSQI